MIDYEKLLKALHRHHVEFIVVGGFAAIVHGSARYTDDLDLVYRRTPENIARLVTAMSPFEPYLRGAPPGLPFEWSAKVVAAGLNFTLTCSIGAVDLLGEIVGGGTYDALHPNSSPIPLFGTQTLVLDLPWLIRVKRAAGRRKDLEAVAELELIQEERES
jgi:hypothetical protein